MGWHHALERWKVLWFAFPYIELSFRKVPCIPEGHSSTWNVEFLHCQAEKFKTKQISSMGWLALYEFDSILVKYVHAWTAFCLDCKSVTLNSCLRIITRAVNKTIPKKNEIYFWKR